MLASLNDLGYEVEWRVINASDYGYPQRRRRVFIVGRREPSEIHPVDVIAEHGVLSRAFPVEPFPASVFRERAFRLDGTLADLTREFGAESGGSPFRNAGVAKRREVWTRDVFPGFVGPPITLGTILQPSNDVGSEFEIPATHVEQWKVLKAAKRQQRYHSSGAPYLYIEGSVPFPDPLYRPARTITTGEGGTSPSRFRHVVEFAPGRFRRLTPVELERLNGFPDGWTDVAVPEGRRAFLMGNALVVGLVETVGAVLAADLKASRAIASAMAS